MKGMLTGPVTILQWSFVRDDQPRASTALRPWPSATRWPTWNGRHRHHPDRRAGHARRLAAAPRPWDAYLDWATRAFRIAASGGRDTTQIHTHMCYASSTTSCRRSPPWMPT
jgi:5-methyltetrahydropteroyltriglutamate--homocysteine methyltransferase